MITKLYGPPRPDALKDAWRDTRGWAREVRLPVVLLVTLTPLLAVAVLGGSRLVGQVGQALYLLVALYGLHLLAIETGQPSLGHAAFLAVGAYATAFLRLRAGMPGVPAALVCGLLGGVLGWLISRVTYRLPASFVALETWALGWLVVVLISAYPALSGGTAGINFGGPATLDLGPLGVQVSLTEVPHLLIGSAILAITVLLVHSAGRSTVGLGWTALRDSAALARALGLDVPGMRMWALVVAGAITAVAGSLMAQLLGVVDPTRFSPLVSLAMLAAVLVGGRFGVLGPILGLVLLTGLPGAVNLLTTAIGLPLDRASGFATAFLTLGALGVTQRPWQRPRSIGTRHNEQAQGNGTRRRLRVNPSPVDETDIALSTRGLSLSYGGVQALENVDFELYRGEIRGLIGPNGSGKSSLLRCLSGTLEVNSGSVILEGEEILPLSERARVRRGIVRTFQRTALLPHLTAAQHVELGLRVRARHATGLQAILQTPAYRDESRARTRASRAILEVFGLRLMADQPGAMLSAGRQRLLHVAAAVATGASVLMLDEPSAGMGVDELDLLVSALHTLAAGGLTMLIVEHNMGFLSRVANRITVIDQGNVLVTGSPASVALDPAVRRAYLGGYTVPAAAQPRPQRNGGDRRGEG